MDDSSPKTQRPIWQEINESLEPGALYVIATPIGNLADITLRALYFLANVDLVAAEDTRHTRLLLERHGIRTAMRSYHEHNAQKVLPALIDHLKSDSTLALVSDAGTPGVSDPGYRLIHEAIKEGLKVVPLPGASALLGAIVPSGLPMDRFTFEGFLPKKKGRQTRLEELRDEPRTMVFFESPQRLGKTLNDLNTALGSDRQVTIAREVTKAFEEFVHGSLGELSQHYESAPVKGEIAIVVEGHGKRIKRREKAEKYDSERDQSPGSGVEETSQGGKFMFPDMALGRGRKQGR
ncbi:16S rRNA (cytidine(1402)-2'-O)-methyltransferase [bacterium]|nr:16S rRNA (cytidine(1402)-2'-O)-methyltransferase [bacterium]